VVDERVRSLIKEDNDETLLKKRTLFGYKYGIIFTLVLVIIWPLPLFFSGYVFSFDFFLFWILASIIWTVAAACFLIFKPLIESKREISTVLSNLAILLRSKVIFRTNRGMLLSSPHSTVNSTLENSTGTNYKRILVAVDGSMPSIRALDYATHFFN